MRNRKDMKGVTLTVLVITVIILLILAGISIAAFKGDKGLLNETKNMKNDIEDLQNKTIDDLHSIANDLASSTGDALNPDNPSNPSNPNPPTEDKTIADIVDKIQDTNNIVEDKNGNKITIPGGFKVVPNSPDGTDASKKVDYTYNGDGTPAVQDGIVIEDNEGNQFVWIPVGDIKNKDGTTTTITLGRYTFNTSDGTPTLQQDADNYTEVVTMAYYYQELTSDSGNVAAKNLEGFVTKTKTNGGYYLGRYEASKGTDNKVKSQADKVVWDGMEQSVAATVAREMYSSNYVESDLFNSYSWDTAIVFIQSYSGNSNYANKNSVNTTKLNTGKAGDKVCNIYDLASNYNEWTTEHSTGIVTLNNTKHPCIMRGGSCLSSSYTTAGRWSYNTGASSVYCSLRPICYIK